MQSQDQLPFKSIPEYPDNYKSGNIIQRMIQGLGYRYYWATEGLTDKDLKYRPSNFQNLIGQEYLVDTIQKSIELNKIPNAYIFTGIRGVGKTTTARIVAKMLNCTVFDNNKNILNVFGQMAGIRLYKKTLETSSDKSRSSESSSEKPRKKFRKRLGIVQKHAQK